MAKFRYFGAKTLDESEREREHKTLTRKAASEGFVLLKNDGVLPLNNKKIALFGSGARYTIKGGTGSGEVNERGSVSIEDGLKNAGYEFNTLWLDRCTKKYDEDIAAWQAEVEKAIQGYNLFTVQKMFYEIWKHPKPVPVSQPISDDELDDAETAVFILCRQAGESFDRKLEKGDYLMTDCEKENIKKLSAHYKKLVLILNLGSVIDLSVLDETRVDAVVFFVQGGMEGGNALADCLSGKVNFSGKLTDTWAYNYSDYPCADTYSHMNGNTDYEEYKEGIFVGYRYFETFGVKPRYPFGFGLSYTTFDISYKQASLNGSNFTLTATVKNTGNFAGKEVVQLYAEKPSANTEKLSLVAFAKTKELKPNESEDITLEFDVTDLAVFGEGEFILKGGEYGLYLGNSVENNEVCSAIKVEKDITVERVNSVVTKIDFEEMNVERTLTEYKSIPCFTVNQAEITEFRHERFIPAFSDKVNNKLKKLSTKQKTMLVTGGGYTMGSGYNRCMDAVGTTSTKLTKKGIPNALMADGPAGLRVTPIVSITKISLPMYPCGLPAQWQWVFLKKLGKVLKCKPTRGRLVVHYMTAFPCETLLAQSWNTELIEEVGKAVGREMKEIGIAIWLAPGMNIHRNPLCGRNFEYYSEDPLLSGKMAAALTRGVQSLGGVGVSIKHYCCNNQEDNRMGVSENLSERALREIYLRGFRIAIEESNPWTVMSSYNRVNGKYVNNDERLLNGVLRDEWGYQGLVMSDWNATDQSSYTEAINTGNDIIMPGSKKIQKALYKEYKKGNLDKKSLDISAARVLAMIYNCFTSEGF